MEHTVHIGVDNLLEIRKGVIDEARWDMDAGVIDEDIDSAVRLRLADHVPHRIAVSDIARKRLHFDGMCAGKLVGNAREAIRVPRI